MCVKLSSVEIIMIYYISIGNRLSNYKNLRSQKTTTGYLHLRWVFILIIAYLFHLRLVMGRRVFQGIVKIVLF